LLEGKGAIPVYLGLETLFSHRPPEVIQAAMGKIPVQPNRYIDVPRIGLTPGRGAEQGHADHSGSL
jgi:hypothetical protein